MRREEKVFCIQTFMRWHFTYLTDIPLQLYETQSHFLFLSVSHTDIGTCNVFRWIITNSMVKASIKSSPGKNWNILINSMINIRRTTYDVRLGKAKLKISTLALPFQKFKYSYMQPIFVKIVKFMRMRICIDYIFCKNQVV